MINKLIISIIGILTARILIVLAAINLVNVMILDKIELTFDRSLLFIDSRIFLIVNIITLIISVLILLGMFSSSSKKKLDDDLKNFSHLSSIREAKRGLTRVQFEKDNAQWEFNKNSMLAKVDSATDNFKKPYNGILTFLKIDDWHKLNTIKKWKIDGKDVRMRAGLPVYMPRFRKKTMFVDCNDNHSLIIGTTNSGKSFSVILQMIELVRMAKESCVINDPKGELYEYTAQQFKDDGYDVICLNFVSPEASDNWAVLELAWNTWKEAHEKYLDELSEWDKKRASLSPAEKTEWMAKRPEPDYSLAIEYITDLANTLTYDANVKDPFWNDSAKDLIIGMTAFLMEECTSNPEVGEDIINFKAIKLAINYADTPLTKDQKKILKVNSNNVLGAILEKTRKVDDVSYMHLMDYCMAPEQTKQSIKKVLFTKINMLTMNEQIMRMTSRSNFDLSNLGKKKTAIYLIVHDEKKTYYPLVTIFLKQLYETIINQARGNKGRLPIPVNVILDEFGNCPPLKDVQSMLTAARSRGVRFTLVVQDLSQLDETYGKNVSLTIQNNCTNTVYILGSQMDTIKNFSNMCGSKQVWIPSKKSYETRPLISVDRLQKLNLGEVVIHRQRKSPFIARMIPYNKCVFYQGKRADPNKPKPTKEKVNWLDLTELLAKFGCIF